MVLLLCHNASMLQQHADDHHGHKPDDVIPCKEIANLISINKKVTINNFPFVNIF